MTTPKKNLRTRFIDSSRLTFALGAVACGLAVAGWLDADAASPEAGIEPEDADMSAYDQGLVEYEIGHYAQALQHFRSAAAAGDVRAPERLALMHRFGERLYGDQVAVDPVEAAHWANVAANQKRAVATAAASGKHGVAP